jgi:hypothetical protein
MGIFTSASGAIEVAVRQPSSAGGSGGRPVHLWMRTAGADRLRARAPSQQRW